LDLRQLKVFDVKLAVIWISLDLHWLETDVDYLLPVSEDVAEIRLKTILVDIPNALDEDY